MDFDRFKRKLFIKMSRSILLNKMTIMLSLLLLSANLFAFEHNGIYYKLNSDSQSTLMVIASPNQSYAGDIVIPNQIIRNGTTFVINEISAGAFIECKSLISVDIPESITEIGEFAFAASSIQHVSFKGDNITLIPRACFKGCKQLHSITFPKSVIEIGEAAFKDCEKLGEVSIPSNIRKISKDAFDYNGLPKDMLWVYLTITIEEASTPLLLDGDISFPCRCLRINRNVRCANKAPFGWKLEEVHIGKNVTEIDKFLLIGCGEALKRLEVKFTTPLTVHPQTFNTIDKQKCILSVPRGCSEKFATAPYWSEFQNIVEYSL